MAKEQKTVESQPKKKHEIYDEKDKRLGNAVLRILGWVALVAGIIGPFVYQFSVNWGLNCGTAAVLCGGLYICFGPKGRTAGGQWLALLKTLGMSIVVLGYFLLIIKYVHF